MLKTHKTLGAAGLLCLAMAAVMPAHAESDFQTGAGTLNANARLDFRVVIPKFIRFQVGSAGATIDLVEFSVPAANVGDGTDVGGGSSIQGTLSGGGKEVISVGEGCLLGANAGIGISLGDRCTVQAGLYVLAGTLVTTPDGQVVKAATLSGQSDLLFRQNSTTGVVEVLSQTVDWGSLNADLHDNG